MTIEGILLHPSTEAQLTKLASEPTHAVLLSGPKGNGKTYTAKALVSQILRKDKLEGYAYFRLIQPKDGSISIEQIRSLISFFTLKVPGSGIRRAAIIEDADLLGLDAQNALLKTLEEPPADSILVLTSSKSQSLLLTIRSRLQLLRFTTPERDELAAYFKQQGYEESSINSALLRSGTNIAEAIQLLEEVEPNNTSINLAKKALSSSVYERLLMVDSLSKQKQATIDFVDMLATIALASLQSAAARNAATLERWQKILESVDVAQNALARNANVKLVITELMLSM